MVLPLRQARHSRLAGHALRQGRQRPHSVGVRAIPRKGHGRIFAKGVRHVHEGVSGNDRLPLVKPVCRVLGSVQRGLGADEHRAGRRLDEKVRPDPPCQRRKRRKLHRQQGRHDRRPQLSAPAHAHARMPENQRNRRVRRLGLRCGKPHLDKAQILGIQQF